LNFNDPTWKLTNIVNIVHIFKKSSVTLMFKTTSKIEKTEKFY
jgi:hypothetical protein